MPSTELLLTFLVTATLYGYVPGPAMLFVAAQTAARGRRYGLMTSFGIHLGTYFHVLAAAFGITVLLHFFPSVYIGMKIAGAAYLIWLGFGLFRRVDEVAADAPSARSANESQALFEGMVVEILNPKTALFYIAFLPQFTRIEGGQELWFQLLVLGCIANVIFSSSDVLCALLADVVRRGLHRSTGRQRLVRAFAGCLLIALGLHLAIMPAL